MGQIKEIEGKRSGLGGNKNLDYLNLESVRDKLEKCQIDGKERRKSDRKRGDNDSKLKNKSKIGAKKDKKPKGTKKEQELTFICEICQANRDHVTQCDTCGKWLCLLCADMDSREEADRIGQITEEIRINWNCTTCEIKRQNRIDDIDNGKIGSLDMDQGLDIDRYKEALKAKGEQIKEHLIKIKGLEDLIVEKDNCIENLHDTVINMKKEDLDTKEKMSEGIAKIVQNGG
ncbi:unnamed protein product [Meganyctiphanes norvegica]|uniref:B box-type domain-containing protein n=1 Tax=Meganyctiphanes norvegica TaxID=48144 RepID=A0AAV2PR07_MEGNR